MQSLQGLRRDFPPLHTVRPNSADPWTCARAGHLPQSHAALAAFRAGTQSSRLHRPS